MYVSHRMIEISRLRSLCLGTSYIEALVAEIPKKSIMSFPPSHYGLQHWFYVGAINANAVDGWVYMESFSWVRWDIL